MILKDFRKSLEDLKNLQPMNVEQNFFDICGFPHYENVVSNVIVHFLNNPAFRQLFLNAILKCLKIDDQEQLVSDVKREVITGDGKRIDILIETRNYVIAIENKVYVNDENQPYDSYRKYLQENFTDKEEQNKKLVLLSMFQDKTKSDCKLDGCIKYQDFLRELKNNAGNYVLGAHLEEAVLFRNFINNLENIMGNNLDINSEECKELFKNSDIITNAFIKLYEYKKQLAINFEEKIKNRFNVEDSWLYPSKSYSVDWLSKNLVLSDFSQYGKICICLWMAPHIYQIALALENGTLKDGIQLKKQLELDAGWSIISRKEHKYESELINLDKCIEEAESMIKEFKNNINDYFEKK